MQLAAHTFESGDTDFDISLVKSKDFELEVEKIKLTLMPRGRVAFLVYKEGVGDINILEFDQLVIRHEKIDIIMEDFMLLESDDTVFYLIGTIDEEYK